MSHWSFYLGLINALKVRTGLTSRYTRDSPPLMKNTVNNRLALLADTLLDESLPFSTISAAVDEFSALCATLTGIEPKVTFEADSGDAELSEGVAINPHAAALCVADYRRTIMFMRGLYGALQAQIQSSKSITLLYAGCGPYATLLLPLLTRFDPSSLTVYLLDVHKTSLDSVKRLLQALKLQEWSVHYIHANACRYQHDEPFDVIVSETMQKALEQEPQFAITANLAPQLKVTGCFVPEAIHCQLWLAHWDQENNAAKRNAQGLSAAMKQRHFVSEAMTLSTTTALSLMDSMVKPQSIIPLQEVEMPNIILNESWDLIMTTQIQVYDRYSLKDYDCDLTKTTKFYEASPVKSGRRYRLTYELGQYPRFSITEHSSVDAP